MSDMDYSEVAERLLEDLHEAPRDGKTTQQKGSLDYAITELTRVVKYLREYEYKSEYAGREDT